MRDIYRLELILPRQKGVTRVKKTTTPHLGLATVAALTPDDVEVCFTDERVTDINLEKDVDLVGISAITITAPRAYEIADKFRERGVKVVLGGMHPSVLPEEAAQHADAVVIGEAEGLWQEIIDDFKRNDPRQIYKRDKPPNPDEWPAPRRNIFDKSTYYVSSVISTSRGCPHSCSFCSSSKFFGRSYRTRPLDAIIHEIEELKDSRFIMFTDDNMAGSHEFAKELFQALIPYKKKWAAQTSISVAKDDELLNLAARSGCVTLFIGFESTSQDVLDAMNKTCNFVDEYEDAMRRLHSYNIAVHGYFMFGSDEDDDGVFKRTVDFCRKVKIDSASFGAIVPFPGTPLYESLESQGRILTKNWSVYDRAVFLPKHMAREALDHNVDWIWREFYSLRSIWNRLGTRPRLLPLVFFLINLIVRYKYAPQRARRLSGTSITDKLE